MIKTLMAAALGAMLTAGVALAGDIKNPLKPSETWDSLLVGDVIGDRQPEDGAALFSIDAPYRAHDAAIVPLRITQAPTSGQRITRMTIVIDENPAPVVAVFDFTERMGHIDLETRVRVDQYSNVRVIAETEDGGLYMSGRFVKASGGCSAPALKGMENAIASAGKMKMRVFEAAETGTSASASARREAQVMIRHPNYSGMQRNQVTQLFIPAFFVNEIEVSQGDQPLFRMEGGISISEDPVFRFTYNPNGADTFKVKATDTDGNTYEKTFPAPGKAA